jgi:serine/threonine-protein kinase
MGLKTVDHRTDLWALGVMTYFALTGARPFDGESIGQLVVAITQGTLAPPSSHRPLLAPIDAWMHKALARDPEARFQSAKELAESFAAAASAIVTSGVSTHAPVAGAVVGNRTVPFQATTLSASVRPSDARVAEVAATAVAQGVPKANVLLRVGVIGVAVCVLGGGVVGWRVLRRDTAAVTPFGVVGKTGAPVPEPAVPSAAAPPASSAPESSAPEKPPPRETAAVADAMAPPQPPRIIRPAVVVENKPPPPKLTTSAPDPPKPASKPTSAPTEENLLKMKPQ